MVIHLTHCSSLITHSSIVNAPPASSFLLSATHYSSLITHSISAPRTAPSFHRHLLLLTKHILIKPFPVMPDGCEAFLWFIDAMTEAFVYDQFGRNTTVLEAAVQLIGIGYGNPPVKFTVLDQGRCADGCWNE